MILDAKYITSDSCLCNTVERNRLRKLRMAVQYQKILFTYLETSGLKLTPFQCHTDQVSYLITVLALIEASKQLFTQVSIISLINLSHYCPNNLVKYSPDVIRFAKNMCWNGDNHGGSKLTPWG